MQANPPLAALWRGSPERGAVESFHRGALAVVDAAGRVVLALGDIDRPVFPRSAVKLLQALPLVASGAAEAAEMGDAELALACASHNGEPAHAATAGGLLQRLGLDDTALECGAHAPYLDSARLALAATGQPPSALHNNCSGKHAGFACLGCAMARAAGRDPRGFLRGYVQPEHPVMREVGAALEAATGTRLAEAPRATDGCSIPTFGIPLRALALGFARVATGQGLSPGHARAAQRLRQAIAAQPFMVAGTGRFDTRVMQRLGERVCCKVGAEAMYCAALPGPGLGVALKIDDGTGPRAAEVTMAAVLEALLPLDEPDRAFLQELSDAPQTNWRGLGVARLMATAELRQALTGCSIGSVR